MEGRVAIWAGDGSKGVSHSQVFPLLIDAELLNDIILLICQFLYGPCILKPYYSFLFISLGGSAGKSNWNKARNMPSFLSTKF